MTREEYIDFANALKNNYTIDFDKLPEFCDMAISTLSTEGEYIKKEETAEYVDSYIQEINTGYGDVNSHTNRILRMISDGIRKMDSYSFPDSAENKPEHEKLMDEINENREKEVVIVPAENKGDLISREWLLNQPLDTSNYPSNYVKLAPPVENTGEWISTEDRPDGFCSKCDTDIYEVSTPYCPYCGAKMTWVGAIHEPYKKGE